MTRLPKALVANGAIRPDSSALTTPKRSQESILCSILEGRDIHTLSAGELRSGLSLLAAAAPGDTAIAPGDSPGSVPVGTSGQRTCYLNRQVISPRVYAELRSPLAGRNLDLARKRLQALESIADVARAAARDLHDAMHWSPSALSCKGSPRSGIRGRVDTTRQDEIRQWSAVTRRPADTAHQALSAGVECLGQSACATAVGGIVVRRYGLASGRDVAPHVVASTVVVTRSGRVRTRGRRGSADISSPDSRRARVSARNRRRQQIREVCSRAVVK